MHTGSPSPLRSTGLPGSPSPSSGIGRFGSFLPAPDSCNTGSYNVTCYDII